jgi:hypothetical protein
MPRLLRKLWENVRHELIAEDPYTGRGVPIGRTTQTISRDTCRHDQIFVQPRMTPLFYSSFRTALEKPTQTQA